MEIVFLIFAFLCGLGARLISLPPLIGYMVAGFILHFFGVAPLEHLESIADLGITLMLFTIGLKLNASDLVKREVWGGTLAHMGIWSLLVTAGIMFLGVLSLPYFSGISLATAMLLAFTFSFSSTVCVVKLLEESGEMKTRHGKLAIGILVVQDIVAVVFLCFATGELPSIWALALVALWFARPLLNRLLEQAGHGEMLPLTGFALALGAYQLFELVGVKGDLGALVIGMLLSSHAKSSELTKVLLSFKDLFLIGFFLSIGFTALPDWSMLGMAGVLLLLLVLKFVMFFFILTGLRLRGRTAFLAATALTNFSEFGLIVAHISYDSGWLSGEWLVILALSMSLSFVLTSIMSRTGHTNYARWRPSILRFERSRRLSEDTYYQPREAEILVVGLGRVGQGAFQALHNCEGDRVWGMDSDPWRVDKLQEQGMHVFLGDGENCDLWDNLDLGSLKLVLLALPSIEDNSNVTKQLRVANYEGQLAAIARYEDDRQHLLDVGIDKVFNFFTEAGLGFAEESLQMIGRSTADISSTANTQSSFA